MPLQENITLVSAESASTERAYLQDLRALNGWCAVVEAHDARVWVHETEASEAEVSQYMRVH